MLCISFKICCYNSCHSFGKSSIQSVPIYLEGVELSVGLCRIFAQLLILIWPTERDLDMTKLADKDSRLIGLRAQPILERGNGIPKVFVDRH